MKNRNNYDFVIVLILIPVFLLCALLISKTLSGGLPDYSVINKSKAGYSVFFETMKEHNYKVYRELKPINAVSDNSIRVVAECDAFDVNNSDTIDWVNKGGILFYLNYGDKLQLSSSTDPYYVGDIAFYNVGKGMIATADISSITNNTLLKDTKKAYLLLKELTVYSAKNIYFNEDYLFSSSDNGSLWGYIPIGIKFIIYQLIITLFAFVYYKSKRFGKALPYYDEVERTENEYLFSAAALYKQGKCWDLMFDSYYTEFLRYTKQQNLNWLEWWRNEELPLLDKAVKVHEFVNKDKNKIDKSEYISIVRSIDELTNIIKKRREKQWNIVKR